MTSGVTGALVLSPCALAIDVDHSTAESCLSACCALRTTNRQLPCSAAQSPSAAAAGIEQGAPGIVRKRRGAGAAAAAVLRPPGGTLTSDLAAPAGFQTSGRIDFEVPASLLAIVLVLCRVPRRKFLKSCVYQKHGCPECFSMVRVVDLQAQCVATKESDQGQTTDSSSQPAFLDSLPLQNWYSQPQASCSFSQDRQL